MKRALIVSGVVAACLPMLFVAWLMMASYWPAMDRLTMKLPSGVRQTIATVAFEKVGWDKKAPARLERVLQLDPTNAKAWSRRCSLNDDFTDATANLHSCTTAIALDSSESNWTGLARAQEAVGNECAAEESFTKAANLAPSSSGYYHEEELGRAALRCGDLYTARAGLEAAIDLENKSLKEDDDDQDEINETKDDQVTDREYLVVTFDKLHEPGLSRQACSAVHPDWKGCVCSLSSATEVHCEASTN